MVKVVPKIKHFIARARLHRDRCYRWWLALPAIRRHFAINIVIGSVVVALIHTNMDASFVQTQQNRGLDWLSRLVTNTSFAPQPQQPIFMVNVDEETYAQWGEPWLTPADKLAALLARLLPTKPAQILIDFDLSRRDDLQPMQDVLASYNAQAEQPTDLIFMKTQALALPENSVLPAFRRSTLDELVAQSERLHWAAPLFRPDADGVVRHWQLLVAGCQDQSLALLPSVQLLSAQLLSAERMPPYRNFLAEPIRGCESSPVFEGELVLASDKSINFAASDLKHRIIYAMPANPAEGYLPVSWNGLSMPALTHVSADALLQAEGGLAANGLLTNAIVIIGATHQDSGDIHATPVGRMPGSQVLANSIVALQGLEQVERPPLWLILLVEMILVVATSWLFWVFSPYTAAMLSAAGVIVLVVPLSLVAFSQGVWLDFALPVLAVQMRSLFFRMNDRVQRVRREGLKALL